MRNWREHRPTWLGAHCGALAARLRSWLVDRGAAFKSPPTSTKAELSAKRLEELRRGAESYRITLDTGTAPEPRPETRAHPPVLDQSVAENERRHRVPLGVKRAARSRGVALSVPVRGNACEDHEFQSLALTGLAATRDDVEVWSPKTAGVTLAPIPDAPVPGTTPAERLRQFTAWRINSRRSLIIPMTSPNYDCSLRPSTGAD